MNRDMLSRRLQRSGYAVLCAEDGQQAVDVARTELPDLILMDVGLPVLNGFDATRQLKNDDKTRIIPIIVLTAHALASDRQEASDAGCDDFDTKPINMPRLLEKISALLPPVTSA